MTKYQLDERVRDILDRVPGWRADNAELTPLAAGITNRNYRVEILGETFVLRLGGTGTHDLGIDRHREHAAALAAAQVGVGAEVVYADPVEDVLITRFIGAAGISPREAARPETLQRIVESIRRFHGGPPVPGTFSAFETVRRYHSLACRYGVTFPGSAGRALRLMERIEATLGPPTRLVPCHNDLLAANFIDDGRTIRIIDWEYAAMGDPFFDLGNFAVNQSLGEAASKILLRAYFGDVRSTHLARLRLMRLASDLRESFWGFLQSGISELEFDFREYGEQHLRRFLKTAAGKHFPRILQEVGAL